MFKLQIQAENICSDSYLTLQCIVKSCKKLFAFTLKVHSNEIKT